MATWCSGGAGTRRDRRLGTGARPRAGRSGGRQGAAAVFPTRAWPVYAELDSKVQIMLRPHWALPVGLGTPASNSRRHTADKLTRFSPIQRKMRRTTSASVSATSKCAAPPPASRPT